MEEEKELAYEDTDETGDEGAYKAKLAKLKTELEACRKEKEEYLQGWQRSKADFINARKTSEIRELEIGRAVKQDLLQEILEIADYFDQAFLKDVPDTQWALGIRRIHESFKALMVRHKIEEIPAEGRRFDPLIHEAIQMVDAKDDADDDRIVEVFQKGYRIGEGVLRPAKVKVARFPEH